MKSNQLAFAWLRVGCVVVMAVVTVYHQRIIDVAILRAPADARLLTAAAGRDEIGFELALADGASADARDADGMTALAWAASAGHPDIVRRLVDAGADVNAHDGPGGATPLMLSLAGGRMDAARVLLARGADPWVPDRHGRNAWDIAAAREDGEEYALLAAATGHHTAVNLPPQPNVAHAEPDPRPCHTPPLP